MGVKEFLTKALKKDGRFKELEREMKMQKLLEERQKNSNERELERYMEEDRQKGIKKHLEEFRKVRQEETWSSGNMLDKSNMFKGKGTILNEDKSILTNNNKLLNMKKSKSKSKSKKGGMFFKK